MDEVVHHTITQGEGIFEALRQGGGADEVRVGPIVIHQQDEAQLRECGSCDMCCIEPGITELRKYSGQSCRHLDQHRCSIYNRRPQVCAVFSCGWRLGNWPELPNPRSCGVMVNFMATGATGELLVAIYVSTGADLDAVARILADCQRVFPKIKVIHRERGEVLVLEWGKKPVWGQIMRPEKGRYEDLAYMVQS